MHIPAAKLLKTAVITQVADNGLVYAKFNSFVTTMISNAEIDHEVKENRNEPKASAD
jgi:hypothetical protein